jgi:hypothetical protein
MNTFSVEFRGGCPVWAGRKALNHRGTECDYTYL